MRKNGATSFVQLNFMEVFMEFVFDYMENDILRHKLNTLTQKIYGFDFENWMAGGYFEGDYIPYSFMQEGKY